MFALQAKEKTLRTTRSASFKLAHQTKIALANSTPAHMSRVVRRCH